MARVTQLTLLGGGSSWSTGYPASASVSGALAGLRLVGVADPLLPAMTDACFGRGDGQPPPSTAGHSFPGRAVGSSILDVAGFLSRQVSVFADAVSDSHGP